MTDTTASDTALVRHLVPAYDATPVVYTYVAFVHPDVVDWKDGNPGAVYLGRDAYLSGRGETVEERMASLRDGLLKGAELLDVALRQRAAS